MLNFVKNYLSTILFIFIAYFFFINISFYQGFLIKDLSFRFTFFEINTLTIYKSIIIAYIIFLVPFYIYYKDRSKARITINYLINKIKDFRYKIKKEEKVAILTWIVKLFFVPLMIVWFSSQLFTMLNNIYLASNDIHILSYNFLVYFQKHLFWLAMAIILFIDLIFFTIWYLIEIPVLNNKIKSVESTFLWWLVVLACYPPFNTYTTKVIWWYSEEFPKFDNTIIHIGLNSSILILMWIYSRASLSLWLKASNLTNRWIVNKWPYKYIRHPAYITKNIVWWIWWMPLLFWNIYLWQFKDFFIVLFSLLAWTFIYYLRAVTEEKHLSMDNDYLEYKKNVKYKFIPKIF